MLYADDSVVVINKPCHLRSVPGHANAPPTLGKRKRPSDDTATSSTNAGGDTNNPSNRQTAQEAWMAAIQSFAKGNDEPAQQDGCASQTDIEHQRVRSFLEKLSTFAKNGIPRKKKLFVKYANRNSQRLFEDGWSDTQNIDATADLAFDHIKERQIPLLNLPEQTKDEESAEGQLKLLGYEDLRKVQPRADQEPDEKKNEQLQNQKAIPKEFFSKIRVVHRLDMETSGLLVFARTEEAASKLCESWRNRDSVKKYYLARCLRWPPFHNARKEGGEIDLPLAPSAERLKWKVVNENEDGAKPSKTLWSVYKSPKQGEQGRRKHDGKDEESASIVLELQPVTGRTHQLRIHCAAIGSGIEGDTLYGDSPIEWDGTAESAKHMLCLHAHRLKFPHPKTGEMMEFTSKAGWNE